jgi:glycosyltransferase involved in cell wall biosynthesis
MMKKLSIILPVYNEVRSIPQLFDELTEVLSALPHEYEIIAVNDGSKDKSMAELSAYAKKDTHIKVIDFLVNSGQTSALRAGIEHATGDVFIPMDSDLENDPHDILKLLKKMEEGFDVVSGWRKERWEGSFFTRKVPSVTANFLISYITGVHLHDYGCTLKVYRAEVLQDVKLYGEMHRFIPAYASWRGATVSEVVVNHRPRKYGKSNYGIGRSFRVLLDLLLIRFLFQYMNKPIHFFGSVGLSALVLGGLAGLGAMYFKFVVGISFISTPLPVLTVLFIIVGVQFIGMGILAEILMRIYYESQGKTPHTIRKTINIGEVNTK